MFKLLSAITAAALIAVATYAAAVELRDRHPAVYTVQHGDTLWDIASRFLNQPWLWPEIWQANPQIENPHRIYPGDVISLAYLEGRPVLQVVQAGERIEPAITAVALTEIAPYLRQAAVVERIDDLPYVVSIEGERLRGADGQIAYLRGLQGVGIGDSIALVRPTFQFRLPAERRRNNVIPSTLDHRGDRPYGGLGSIWATSVGGAGEILGYELTTMSLARITQIRGEVTLALLVDGTAEVRPGDRAVTLTATQAFDDRFVPQPPPATLPEYAAVLAVADASLAAGPRSVVALAVGSADGISNGTVFSAWRPGNAVADDVSHRNRISAHFDKVQLPDEYSGRVMVFRTFERVSYALVMDAIRPITVGDTLKAPDATY